MHVKAAEIMSEIWIKNNRKTIAESLHSRKLIDIIVDGASSYFTGTCNKIRKSNKDIRIEEINEIRN